MSAASSDTGNKFPSKGPAVAWGPVEALAVCVFAFLGAQFVVGALLVLLTSATNLTSDWLASTAGQFLFVVFSDILILLIIWAFLRKRKAGLASIGLGRKPRGEDWLLAALGYLFYFGAFFVVAVLASMLTQINLEQRQETGFESLFTSTEIIMGLISLVILPPIVEEVVFRGFLYSGMRKKLKFFWAATVTSLLFAGLHLLGSSEGLLWVAALDTLVLSYVLCYLREKTGALWAPMAVHGVKNAIAFALLISSVAVL